MNAPAPHRRPRRRRKRAVRLRQWFRAVRDRSLVWFLEQALARLGNLPLDEALRRGERYGTWAYRLLGRPRQLTLDHLDMAFGSRLPPSARERIARAAFVNAARSFCELAKIDEIRERRDTYFEIQGREHAEALVAAGRGAIIVTGHIGNWELLAAYWAWEGYPISAIARRIRSVELNRMLVELRARQGVETILREEPAAARKILSALKRNALLAMLIDQDTRVQSFSVPFFGHMARTPIAAASLAVRRELPVALVFMQRRPQGGHRIIVEPPLLLPRSGDTRQDVQTLTRVFNDRIEAQIERNPAEWVWWHRRWRRTPHVGLDLDS